MAGPGTGPLSAPDFYSLIIQSARTAGFPVAGALDFDQAPEIQDHVRRYDRWLAEGFAGSMDYLVRGRDRRADPRSVFPDAQSILCVAEPYPATSPDPSKAVYARYLNGTDYHQSIHERLEAMMRKIAVTWEAQSNRPLRWKVCVDTSAVLERSWASLAGLGWIGKNSLLIHPKLGSYLLLGEVLISEKTSRGPSPLPNYCGHCTRCLTSCPTSAFSEPGLLDSRRCISYWTLEKRGELGISEDDKRKIGTRIAGCDICQEVCPFNVKAVKNQPSQLEPTPDLIQDWGTLLDESEPAYRLRVKKSALNRVRPAQFRRNLAIAIRNAIDDGRLPVTPGLAEKVQRKLREETDAVALTEWQSCVASLKPSLNPDAETNAVESNSNPIGVGKLQTH